MEDSMAYQTSQIIIQIFSFQFWYLECIKILIMNIVIIEDSFYDLVTFGCSLLIQSSIH